MNRVLIHSLATYALIYSFLKSNKHALAARELKKSVKDSSVLNELEDSETPLETIIEEWMERRAKATSSVFNSALHIFC